MRIRIATWNCFGAPQAADDFFEGRPFWPERLDAPDVERALADFDIVCVQENLVTRVRESLERLQRAARFAELWFDPMGPDEEDGTFAGGGLAILSRFPMRVRFQKLPRGAGPDGFARKGIAIADIDLPNGATIHVVNTHLQADDPIVPIQMCRDARRAQTALLVDALASLRDAPAILCGDLNIAFGSAEYDELRRALGDELLDLASKAGLATFDISRNDLAKHFYPNGPTGALFDYIWIRPTRFQSHDVRTILDTPLTDVPGAPPSYARRPFPSDHFGIGATLELLAPRPIA